MSNIECEKEFARRAALNPIRCNSTELDAKRYQTLKAVALMSPYSRRLLQEKVLGIGFHFKYVEQDIGNHDAYTDACTALIAQQEGDMK
jgi:hypothetical protein